MGNGIAGSSAAARTITFFDGMLYVGGSFETADGAPSQGIVRWDGSSWSAVGPGVHGSVFDLVEFEGNLIVGGLFDGVGPVATNNLAKWNEAVGFRRDRRNDLVYDLHVQDGILAAGGQFTHAGDRWVNSVAVWDGQSWGPLGPDGYGLGRSEAAGFAFLRQADRLLVGEPSSRLRDSGSRALPRGPAPAGNRWVMESARETTSRSRTSSLSRATSSPWVSSTKPTGVPPTRSLAGTAVNGALWAQGFRDEG
ncbi:MAG: hypothetical protein R3E97_21655 [Candidatus Eisenbacteria bacterium]